MTWKLFYELTEIYTTPLDVMWLVFAISYSYLYYGSFNFFYGIIGFICVFSFHLLINMHNNYMDYKNSKDTEVYRKKVSTIGTNHVSLKLVRNWIIGLSVLPFILSMWLVSQTGLTTLWIGIFCVLIGIFYSFGPRPLNSTPIAEVSVATAITFFIPLVYIYLGMDNRASMTLSEIGQILLACLPNLLVLFNLLLTNNTSDLEEDIKNGRHTLVYFLGKKNALRLFQISWTAVAILLPALALLHKISYLVVLVVLIYPIVFKTIKPFLKVQDKKTTYFSVLKGINMTVMTATILFALGTLFKI